MDIDKRGHKDGKHIDTGGGSYIAGGVQTSGGDFVARDKITIYQGPTYARLNYRSDISDILKFYTTTFVGRTQERTDLVGFASQVAPGYWLVEALPGYGKSALMAHLVDLHEIDRWDASPKPDLLYFFVRQQGGNNTPTRFLQAINSQLLDLLDLPGGVPPELNALSSQFSQLWAGAVRAASTQAPLLLLVDGLDEMAAGDVTIADLLPTRLAPYVHVIVSSRPYPESREQVRLEHPLREAEVRQLHTFNTEDVKALLLEYGASVKAATRLAPRVLDMTKGEPLFARFVSQEVAAKGEAVLKQLEKDTPTGVEEYFRQQFKLLDETVEGDLTWKILGLFVVALGGLTTGELADVLQVGKRRVRKAIDPIRRFLLGEERLALMHLELRNVLTGEFSGQEQEASQKQLLDYCANWQEHHSPYALTHYVDYLKEAGQTEKLYGVILNKAFRKAQQDVLGDTSATLDDLRLALKLALKSDLFKTALACVAAYRYTTRTTSIAQAIFDAVDSKDFEKALKLATLKGAVPDWGRVLHLYLLWGAALAKDAKVNYEEIVATAEHLRLVQAQQLCDALLVRIARTLARDDQEEAKANLVAFNRGQDADELLKSYALAQPLCEAEANSLRVELESRLQSLEKEAAGGDAQVIRDVLHDVLRPEDMAEETPMHTQNLRHQLLRLAAHPYGKASVESILDVVLVNPYPRYRDMGLVECGLVSVAAPEDAWARQTLRRIIYAGLDREGMIFTFDLPFMLLKEAQRRGLPESQQGRLPEYRQTALDHRDRWGTSLRALNARAAALFRQGEQKWAFDVLRKAAEERLGFAGYATLHMLALANRWQEFGRPELASELIEAARENADKVRAKDFRHDRLQLVETYRTWQEETVDVETGLATLAQILDVDTRLAYIDHLSARWAWPAENPNRQGLKKLVPLALVDGTILDTVLARLCGLYLASPEHRLSNDDLAEAIRICDSSEMMNRPWEMGPQSKVHWWWCSR